MKSFARLTKFILGSFVALAVLAVLLTTALLLLDLDLLRGQLESRAAAAFGRRVAFEGTIRLEPSLPPIFVAENFRIGNPDWASRPDLAQVERLEVQVALFPLFRGELQVLGITFRGADVLLEVGPDDTNNFTFGSREGPPELPDIDTLRVQDSVLGYRAAGGELHRCAVIEGRAKNMPKQPLQLEGQVTCRDVPMQFSLSGGTPEQFASLTVPWPLTLTVSTEDASLDAEGSLPGPGSWNEAEFQISIQAEKADSLEALFDLNLPVRGPFELSGEISRSQEAYSISDLKGRIGSTDIAGELHWQQTEARSVLKGKIASQSMHVQDLLAASDPNSAEKPDFLDRPIPLDWIAAIDAELELDVKQVLGTPVSIDNAAVTAKLGNAQLTVSPLQATLAGIPLTGDLAIVLEENEPAISLTAQTKQLDLVEIIERLEASAPVHGNAENVTLTANSRGHTLRTLLQHADLSLKTQGGQITSGDAQTEQPFTLEIATTEIEAREAQPISISVDGTYRGISLSLVADTVTLQALVSGISQWPLKLTVNSGDVSFVAKGSLPKLGTWDGAKFQVSIQGKKVDSLDALFEVSLPVRRAFKLSAKLSKSKDAYSVSDLEGKIGSTDIAGELQWKQEGRYVLNGKIASRSLHLQDFFAESKSRSAGKTDFLDRPIPLDWIAAVDAKIELDIKRFLGTSAPIRNAAATAKLSNGQLTLSPLRATLAGIPLTGDISIALGQGTPTIRVAAQAKKLDLNDILKPLKASAPIQGRAKNLTFTMNSHGRTMRALLQRAKLSLKTQGGRIAFASVQAKKPFALEIAAAEIKAKVAQPIRFSVDGAYQAIPLKLVVDTVTLQALASGTKPWPLSVSLQALQASLKASGSVVHPFQGRGFDLGFEIAGKDLQKLDPLIDYVLPVQGEYQVSGRFSNDTNRYDLSDLQAQVGQSDIGGSMVIAMEQPRPRITASLNSRTIHYKDLAFVKEAGKGKNDGRVIPEYALPVDALLAINLDVDLKAERIRTLRGELGYLVLEATLDNGASVWSADVTDDRTGARLIIKHEVDVTTNPPVNSLHLTARDLDYGLALAQTELTDFAEGRVDVKIELAGLGATLRSFLSQADGRIEVIGGSGRIASRELDLWASDLVRTMLSVGWRRESITELNCIVGHIDVKDGIARTDKLLLDTQRLTIAGSGALDLDTERLDLLLSPSPKQVRLVSLANPVHVTGTLAAPSVAVTKLPRSRMATASGLLAGLVNPAYLLLVFSDIGSGNGNPCVAAIEQRDLAPSDKRQRRGILQRFRNLF